MDDEQCANTTLPPMEQVSCTVHCPDECVLSSWSEWTPCSLNHGRRTRTRFVIAMPAGHQSCPSQEDLVEEQICSKDQLQHQSQSDQVFTWFSLPWGRCRLPTADEDQNDSDEDEDDGNDEDQPLTCGTGIKRREVRCTRVSDGRHVDDSHCRLLVLNKPETQRVCTIPCPVECHLSDWSEWSPCTNEEDAIQSRIRVVLHQPQSSGSGDDRTASSRSLSGRINRPAPFTCPPLVEKRSCYDQIVQQERIQWQLSEWTSCQPPVNAKCGTGISTRSNYTFYIFSVEYNLRWADKRAQRLILTSFFLFLFL